MIVRALLLVGDSEGIVEGAGGGGTKALGMLTHLH